jgi:phage N-6-adenine-methyltransferase
LLKQFDDTNTIVEEDDDNYETPDELFYSLTTNYNIIPRLDACATKENTKCQYFLTDALHQQWMIGGIAVDVWCNPPGSLQLKFIERAESQYLKYNMNIIMIVPANCVSTEIWHQYIERKREYYAVKGRPIFLKNGRKTKFPSRNSYVCIVWRRK